MESNERDYGPKGESLQFAPEAALPPEERTRILDAHRAAEAEKDRAFWQDILEQ